MNTSYLQDLRKYPECHPELPPDAILTLDDDSKHYTHKVVLATQSDFFEGLFTFEDKMHYQISNPIDHQLNKENFELILDTFYEIEPDFLDQDQVVEIRRLANYLLAPFLMKKCQDL